MCCCSVSYVGCVLLFLTENMQIVNFFIPLREFPVGYAGVFCDK